MVFTSVLIQLSLMAITVEYISCNPVHKTEKAKISHLTKENIQESNLQKLLHADKLNHVPQHVLPPMSSDKAASQADIPVNTIPLALNAKNQQGDRSKNIDLRPDRVAAYLFKTRDFKGFEDALENSKKMSRPELLQYRAHVAVAYRKLLEQDMKNKESQMEVKAAEQETTRAPVPDMEEMQQRAELAKAISLERIISKTLEQWLEAMIIKGIDEDPVIDIEEFAQFLYRQAGDIRRIQEEQLGELVELVAESIKQKVKNNAKEVPVKPTTKAKVSDSKPVKESHKDKTPSKTSQH